MVRSWIAILALAGWLAAPSGVAQLSRTTQTVKEVKLRALGGEQVRPLEHVAIEMAVFGEEEDRGRRIEGRLKRTAQLRLEGDRSGWLSKGFACPEHERQLGTYVSAADGRLATVLGMVNNFVIKDCVLYTAPEQPGTYYVEAEADGQKTRLALIVDAAAESRRKPERVTFPEVNRDGEPYRAIAEHYAPFVAQETWFQPKADYLARFDYDGNWRGDDNWENLEEGSSQAYVYYEAMETATHWFLIYNLFHPRDYSDRCVVGTCHENDNEGLILTVRKDGSEFGSLQVMETLAHNNIYSYTADTRVRNGVHDIDGRIELVDGSHPAVFVESGGHGIYGSADAKHSRYRVSEDRFAEGTGVTFAYKGVAERPVHPDSRRVGYELLLIGREWWSKACEDSGWQEATYDDFYAYEPFGGRPPCSCARLSGAFLGRAEAANKAKPFWGWHDERTRKGRVLNTGQWGLDPAYAVSRNLSFPSSERFSLEYAYNPYLGVGTAPAAPAPVAMPAPAPAQPVPVSEELRLLTSRLQPGPAAGREGELNLRFRLDGSIELHIRGDRVLYRQIGGPAPVDEGSEFTSVLPAQDLEWIEVEQLTGRNRARFLEEPSHSNEYTALLEVSDEQPGEDRYHFRIRWARKQGVVLTPENRPPAPVAVPPVTSQPPAPPSPPVGSAPSAAMEMPGDLLQSSDNDPGAYDFDNQGMLEFRGRVDHEIRFHVRGDRLYGERVAGRPVEIERFRFTQPLPASPYRSIEVRKRDGRGAVELIQKPAPENNYTAIVRVLDSGGGDARYHFQLIWTR